MLRMVMKHKQEIISEGRWLYNIICGACIATETIVVGLVVLVINATL